MNIEIMKARAEMLRVQSARAEMEVNIYERKEEIKRLEMNMKIQDDKINEIQLKLNKLQGE